MPCTLRVRARAMSCRKRLAPGIGRSVIRHQQKNARSEARGPCGMHGDRTSDTGPCTHPGASPRTMTCGRMRSSKRGPMPRTASRSSTLRYGPCSVRWVTIRPARTGPTPGRGVELLRGRVVQIDRRGALAGWSRRERAGRPGPERIVARSGVRSRRGVRRTRARGDRLTLSREGVRAPEGRARFRSGAAPRPPTRRGAPLR